MSKRTTLTLDDDTAALIDEEMRRSGASFREAVNELLRAGAVQRKRAGSKRKVTVPSKSMGLRPGLQLDSISSLLDEVEGPLHR